MPKKEKKRQAKSAFYFVAIAAVTAVAFAFIIKEGQRIKMENQLLAYEVW